MINLPTLLSLLALPLLTLAQNPFSFTSATLPATIPVGKPFNITWSPSTGTTDTVSLVLRQGDSAALKTVAVIASKIQNSGSYIWTPSPSLPNGPLYAFQIIDDGNTDIVNYSGQFAISSSNTVTPASSSPTGVTSSAAVELTSVTGTASETAETASGTSGMPSQTGTGRSASGTSTQAASATETTTAPSGNAGVRVRVSGGFMAVLGGVMAVL